EVRPLVPEAGLRALRHLVFGHLNESRNAIDDRNLATAAAARQDRGRGIISFGQSTTATIAAQNRRQHRVHHRSPRGTRGRVERTAIHHVCTSTFDLIVFRMTPSQNCTPYWPDSQQ